jgi:hypothetical protein
LCHVVRFGIIDICAEVSDEREENVVYELEEPGRRAGVST